MLKKIIIVVVMVLFSATSTHAHAPNGPLWTKSVNEQIEFFSKAYGTDPAIIKKVIECESGGNHKAVGDGGRSKGIAQIQEPTWKDLERKFRLDQGHKLNYTSRYDQLKLTTWSIANGEGRRWTAYRAIMNGGTYSFYSKQLQQHFKVTCKL